MGLLVAFLFIFFMQFAKVLTTFGNFPVWLAAWLPVILFGLIGLILLRFTPK
jgi:lipopolysaccharide export LptBFGC system permease protein LptF